MFFCDKVCFCCELVKLSVRRKVEGERHQLIKVEVSEERHVESWLSRNSRGVVESEESWKRKRHKIGKVEEPKNGEPEESTNGRIGRVGDS